MEGKENSEEQEGPTAECIPCGSGGKHGWQKICIAERRVRSSLTRLGGAPAERRISFGEKVIFDEQKTHQL